MKITIIGAGVAGLTAATEFSERGFDVTLVDRGPGPGPQSCSWYAGGMLAPWCEGESAEEPVVRYGAGAIEWWRKRVPGVRRSGSLVLACSRDAGELTRFARRTGEHVTLDGDGIAELEPDLAGRFSRALHFTKEAHLDPRQALESLVQTLVAKNCKLRFETGAEDVSDTGEGIVVDARGFAARDALPDLRGVKGEMLVVRCRDITLSRPVRLLHPRFPVYIVPRDDNTFMIGATQIESEDHSRITARGMVDLLNAAYALHPAFAEAEILETGTDVRPAFADNLPRIRWRGDRIYVNGLFRHGFLLAPACAQMVAEKLADPDFQPEFMDEDYSERASA